MRRQRSSSRFAVAWDNVDHTVGESSLSDQFSQQQGAQRSLLGGLQHNGAAGRQRRPQLPRGHQQWEVPGNDLSDHAHGLAPGISVKLGGKRDGVAFNLGGPARHVAEQIDSQGNVGHAGDGQRLAVVQALQLRELLQMLLDQVGELPDQAAAIGSGHLRPRAAVESLARCLHGAIDVFTIAFGDLGHHLAGGGIVGGEGLSGSRLHPLAIDKHFARRG